MTDVSGPGHRYTVGQSVFLGPRALDRSVQSGSYTVTRLLPPDGSDNQYRIKSMRDGHERVVKESQLG